MDINKRLGTKQPLIAALYARVSTGRQEHEETIESQVAEIKERIQVDGNFLPNENVFLDDGWTGEILERPSLDAMRDAARDGKFQVLYVYDRGRISRIFFHQEIVLEELRDEGVQFISLHDLNALTPEERVLQGMQGLFAEYERVKIAERMRRGKMYKAKAGIIISGGAIYGYSYIKKTEKDSPKWTINAEEAEVVQMIYRWVGVEGISIREVIRRLYDKKIYPRKKKREFWTKGPIVRLLQSETYFNGIAYYNKSEAIVAKRPLKHEKYKKVKRTSRRVRPKEEWVPFNVPVLMEDYWLFEKVQLVLQRNKKFANRKRKRDYLLTGLLFCECGSRRVGDGTNEAGHFYYRCSDRIKKFPLRSECGIPGVNAGVLDAMLWQQLKERLEDSTLLHKAVEEFLQIENDNVEDAEILRLQSLMQRLEEEEKRYAQAYGMGALQLQNYQNLMKDVNKRRDALQAQMSVLKTEKIEKTIAISPEELYNEAQSVIREIDFTDKQGVIRDVVDKVTIKERSGVDVWVHVPLSTQKLGNEPERRNSGPS